MTTPTMPTPELYFDTIFAYQRSAVLKSALSYVIAWLQRGGGLCGGDFFDHTAPFHVHVSASA